MRQNRLLIGFLNAGHAVDHLVMLIYPTVVLTLAADLGRPYGELLPLALGGFIAFGVFSLPAGWLGDRWSRHRMLAIFFCGAGAATALVGLARNDVEIFLGLTAVGAFAAIYHPVGNALLVRDAARVGRRLGVNGLFGNLGLGFAALIAGALSDLVHWRAAFLVPGLLTILIGVAFLLLVDDPGQTSAGSRAAAPPLPRATMVRVFAILVVATVAGGVVFTATTVAMPKVFEERLTALTGSALGIGALVCMVYVLAAFAQLCVGPLIDRFEMRSVFVPVVALQAPLLLLAASLQNWPMLIVAVLMMFVVFGQIPINDAMVARYATEEWRSRVYALRYLMSFGASAAAVPLVALLHRLTGGFESVFAVLAAVAACTLAAALAFPSRRHPAPGAGLGATLGHRETG